MSHFIENIKSNLCELYSIQNVCIFSCQVSQRVARQASSVIIKQEVEYTPIKVKFDVYCFLYDLLLIDKNSY